MSRFVLKSWHERVFFALVLLPVVLVVVWKGGWIFKIFLMLAAARAIFEWGRLAFKTRYPLPILGIGIVYIGFAFWAFYLIRMGFPYPAPAFIFLSLIFSSDIGAYIFGKYFRGSRMTPTISPNKTWAGMVGAVILPVSFVLIFLFCAHIFYPLPDGHYAGESRDTLLIIALLSAPVVAVIGFAGQMGDLLVSLLKRAANTKDTGSIIPGHGGLLDRLDSMMLAGLVYFALLVFVTRDLH